MSVYVSYTDETESPDQRSGHFLIAGYVGDESKWPEFSRLWEEKILLSAPQIPYIHMVDIRSEAWRLKHGISRAEADEKVRRAVDLIAATDFFDGYITQVPEPAYLSALKILNDGGINRKRNPSRIDYICFIAYSLQLVKQFAMTRPDVRKIIFAISKKMIVSHHISHDLYDAMVNELKEYAPDLAAKFGEVLPLDMENQAPLQAADILCWHLQRSARNVVEEDEVIRNTNILTERAALYALNVPGAALEDLAKNLIKEIKEQSESE